MWHILYITLKGFNGSYLSTKACNWFVMGLLIILIFSQLKQKIQYVTNEYKLQLNGFHICADNIFHTIMSLGLSGIFHLLFVYFILACFICALGNTYSQNEIDNVFVKLIKREMYYAELDGQLGCWPQNVIPYTIQNGFCEYTVLKYKIDNR